MENNKKQKSKNLFIEIIIFLTLIIFGYFAIRYWYFAKDANKKGEVAMSKISDSQDIFGSLDNYKSDIEDHDLSDMTINELKDKSADFVYKILIKNQDQIAILKQKVQDLNDNFLRYKANGKIGKITFAYIEFRQDIFSGKKYDNSLKNFEALVYADEKIQNKISKIKPLLNNFLNKEGLQNDFSKIIPKIIANKNGGEENSGFLSQIKSYLSKLVVIRRINGAAKGSVDEVIVEIERSLQQENYEGAMVAALVLDQTYHEILNDFLNKLNAAIEVRKIDQDILIHLKKLS